MAGLSTGWFINHQYSCSGVFNFILPSQALYEDIQEEDSLMSPAGTKRTSQSSYVVAVSSSMCHALLDVPACYAGYRHWAMHRPGARRELMVVVVRRRALCQNLCSLESVCGQACVYRHIARCVFTTIFINHKYSCSGVFNLIISLYPIIFRTNITVADIFLYPVTL